jgi:hypothetical protein
MSGRTIFQASQQLENQSEPGFEKSDKCTGSTIRF